MSGEEMREEFKKHKALGYCTSCNEWPWHKCPFCGAEKRTAGCLLGCRVRHKRIAIFSYIRMLLNPWHPMPMSPWNRLFREIKGMIFRESGKRSNAPAKPRALARPLDGIVERHAIDKGGIVSNRTMLEFNHDYTPHTADERYAFLQGICDYLSSGDHKRLPIGVTYFYMRHHSTDCPLGDPPKGWRNEK